MTYHHQLPVGTLVTCVYDPRNHPDKPSYLIAGIVVKEYPDRSCWRILSSGWNHSLGKEIYSLPEVTEPDYHSFVVHTTDTFPYPELLI